MTIVKRPPILDFPAAEKSRPKEANKIAERKAAFDIILKRTSQVYGHAIRVVHAKVQAP